MIIPVAFAHVQHYFSGSGLPNGAAITYGVSGFGSSTPEVLAQTLHGILDDNWLAHISTAAALQETRVKMGPNSIGPFGSHVETIAGRGSASQAPPNVALLIEKRTAVGGRAGRGRMYLPAISEDVVEPNGAIEPASLVVYQGVADAWLSDIETAAFGMWILHSASSDPTAVTSLTVDPVAATQRRRLR